MEKVKLSKKAQQEFKDGVRSKIYRPDPCSTCGTVTMTVKKGIGLFLSCECMSDKNWAEAIRKWNEKHRQPTDVVIPIDLSSLNLPIGSYSLHIVKE